jgi:hypothetical protein
MSGYIVVVQGEGYLRDPDMEDMETLTPVLADAYVFYHRDEAESAAENWCEAAVVAVHREEP